MMPVPENPRMFAIVPAAGHSRRMGRPKLLLPLGPSTVIARMLAVLRRPEIVATVVVIRPDDQALRAAVEAAGATPLQPDIPPAEMRQSVEHGLRYMEHLFQPRPDDGWVLAPADHPLLEPALMDPLVAAWRGSPGKILVPTYRGKRGHPAIFPFRLAAEVFSLPADQGLNSLLKRHASEIDEIEINSSAVVADLDTPDDYARLQAELDGA